MTMINSPLRYPGGKSVLAGFLADLLRANDMRDGIYVEPFAGGAGAALNLLFAEHVQHIIINDVDRCITSFWRAILNQTKAFIELLHETPVTIDEWNRQSHIYRHHLRYSQIKVAFASFFLNRCNRSGILMNAGPIGGKHQEGAWKLHARYNKKELIRRINKISLYKKRIHIYNMDAIKFLSRVIMKSKDTNKTLVYLDPPYYSRGNKLYLNHFQHKGHVQLARYLKKKLPFKWIMSYDNVPEIRSLYHDKNQLAFELNYSAHKAKVGSELLIYNDDVVIPYKLNSLKKVS